MRKLITFLAFLSFVFVCKAQTSIQPIQSELCRGWVKTTITHCVIHQEGDTIHVESDGNYLGEEFTEKFVSQFDGLSYDDALDLFDRFAYTVITEDGHSTLLEKVVTESYIEYDNKPLTKNDR